jgi:hypothetical protein
VLDTLAETAPQHDDRVRKRARRGRKHAHARGLRPRSYFRNTTPFPHVAPVLASRVLAASSIFSRRAHHDHDRTNPPTARVCEACAVAPHRRRSVPQSTDVRVQSRNSVRRAWLPLQRHRLQRTSRKAALTSAQASVVTEASVPQRMTSRQDGNEHRRRGRHWYGRAR